MTREHGSLKPLSSGECFLLDHECHRTVAIRLPVNVASEISGEDLLIAEGFVAKFKS